jgi:hypothetical protein
MNMVPRFPERVLGALGATPDFRDDVLGDLAEEFVIHAEWDGPGRARRWYYREALRAAPYLLRDGLRSLRPRDVFRLTGAILLALIGVRAFRAASFLVLNALLTALGLPISTVPLIWLAPIFLLLNAITPTVGGYVAAWAHRKAPLLAAITLGVVWSAIDVATIAAHPEWPALYRFGAPLIALVFTTMGGLLRVLKGRAALA